MTPVLKIIYNEETKKHVVVDVSTNVWHTVTYSGYDLETAIAIKKAFEEGYRKGKSDKDE